METAVIIKNGEFFDREILFTSLKALTARALCECQLIMSDNPIEDAVKLGCKDVIICENPNTSLITGCLDDLIGRHILNNISVSTVRCQDRYEKVCIFNTKFLQNVIKSMTKSNLADIITRAVSMTYSLESLETSQKTDIDDEISFCDAHNVIKRHINMLLVLSGVRILDIDNTYISPDCVIGKGTCIYPNVTILNGTIIGEYCTIISGSLLDEAKIGDGTYVNSSQIRKSTFGKGCVIGPFSHIRPDCFLGDNVKVGNFVELKKSTVDRDTKIPHLTYVGDAKVGKNVNFGCGTVVVNYDGYSKYLTEIEDNAFIGCNTNLVSPVKVGKNAFTAAGSTVTSDVPDDALCIARSRGEIKQGWAISYRKRKNKE